MYDYAKSVGDMSLMDLYADTLYRSERDYMDVKEMILKVQGLKAEPVPNEQPLSKSERNRLSEENWLDITGDQNARNEAALDLKEKMLDEKTKDDWAILIRTFYIEYSDSRPRTIAEGALLNGDGGRPLPDIVVSGLYDSVQYDIYARDSTSGKVVGPVQRYLDLDGNGRIDFKWRRY
jgi:hypothetical protein